MNAQPPNGEGDGASGKQLNHQPMITEELTSSLNPRYTATMLILGIESSCDETSVAIVENGRKVRANVISSSANHFAAMGGVVPEMAARTQLECVLPVLQAAVTQAGVDLRDLGAIAVTAGPGLLGSLLVGTCTARILGAVRNLPVIPVHHTLGHLYSTWIEQPNDPVFPYLCLSVSGGHTELWYCQSHTIRALLGTTRDDAAGEAFDKGAKLLGLPYPGGPALAHLAEQNTEPNLHNFTRSLSGEQTLDFSFSGLKTALLYLLRDHPTYKDERQAWVAASFQAAICEQLVDRVELACTAHPEICEIHVVGGVSANRMLRSKISEIAQSQRKTVRYPVQSDYCTDNAAMIASAGFFSQHAGAETFVTFASGSLAEQRRQNS